MRCPNREYTNGRKNCVTILPMIANEDYACSSTPILTRAMGHLGFEIAALPGFWRTRYSFTMVSIIICLLGV